MGRRGQERPGLGPLESAVLEALWSAEAALSVRDVITALSGREPAYTTISTVLENLRRKGWVDRERTGRVWFYRPLHERSDYAARLMHGALVDSGDPRATLLRFIDDMSDADAATLRALLADVPREE
ncbi:BlaI/MecI/CopY family transcriptional regulator [Nocardiopsis coralliicola]